MFAMDSVNNIFGRVLNPLNRENWTAGGSSGGEAALVRMRGCTMGVGTDVGGSVRVPAAVNGIVGLKPGSGRVSTRGMEEGREEGKENVGLQSVVGPIASRLDDLALFMEVVEEGRMWKVDPQIRAEEGWWTRPGSSLMAQKTKEKVLRVGIIYGKWFSVPRIAKHGNLEVLKA